MWDQHLRGVQLRRSIFLLAVMVPMSISAQAPASAPLLYRIVLPHAVLCVVDRHLEIEAELRNVSDHQISLSPAGILSQLSFTNRASSLEDGFRTKSSSNDPLPGWKGDKVVTLAPGASYRQTVRLELDREFFSPGVYRVQASYSGRYGATKQEGLFLGTVDSNEALFEIDDCQPPESKKP
jgi:hypothetical protein